MENALTLEEAAAVLGVSYSTIFAKRREIAFRLPGSRIWRVWPSTLYAFQQNRDNMTPLSLRGVGEPECLSSSAPKMASTTSILPSQVEKELNALLAPKTK